VHRCGVEFEEVTIGQRGGQRRRRSVDRGVAASVGTARGEVEAGRERKMKVEKGELVDGALPL
jgi:hypothetical protein